MTSVPTETLEAVSASPGETRRWGRLLGRHARPGDLVLLIGELGSGKTTLTQGIAWGLGVREYARSPTFVLMARYQGRLPLHHIDLYRVSGVAEALDLGLEEVFQGGGVCVVEWADRALEAFPAQHLEVRLEAVDAKTRRLWLEAHGKRHGELLRAVADGARRG
jgi:tRNA threonylcarbamoyladenosine biosynthesis protein TsaE